MARLIIDSVVNKRFDETKADRTYYDDIPTYSGNAKNTLEKIRTESIGVINPVPIYATVKMLYEQLPIEGPVAVVDSRGEESVWLPVSETKVRLLKALLHNQVNRDAAYSAAVAKLAVSMLYQILDRRKEIKFEVEEDMSIMEKVIFTELGKFVLDTIATDEKKEKKEVRHGKRIL